MRLIRDHRHRTAPIIFREHHLICKSETFASALHSSHTNSKDPAMNGPQGKFTCTDWSEAEKTANSTRRGFLHVNRAEKRNGRYFIYADGTPFLWIGDTWWNWSNRGIPLERFKVLADDRAEKGFTLGQLFFAARGWGDSSSLLDETCMHPEILNSTRQAFCEY